VLVAGGFDGGALPDAEFYDPVSGTWSVTDSLSNARYLHTATLLSNGQVLVAGGLDSNIAASATAELYDPASGTWATTGSLSTGRYWHTATLLPDGDVLAAGGFDSMVNVIGTSELYDSGVSTTAKVDGRGSINGAGDNATFNFHAAQSGDSNTGSFSYRDPAAGLDITSGGIKTITINGGNARFGGNARLDDGTVVKFSVRCTDKSGTGAPDTFFVRLTTGYSAGGDLTSGDIRITK
jgi:hypothetical protein